MVFLAAGDPDLCQWTEWTSCDYFCGTPRVKEKIREKASNRYCEKDVGLGAGHGECLSTNVEEEQCDANQECTRE